MPRPAGSRPYECVRRAWHSDRHQPIRGSLIQEIFRIANEAHCPSTRKNREWQEKLPIVVLKAEEIIYSKANSEDEYSDLKTLWKRVKDAIDVIIRRDGSTETGQLILLQPCIEAALHLGCTPRRSSRSQHNECPGHGHNNYLMSRQPETIKMQQQAATYAYTSASSIPVPVPVPAKPTPTPTIVDALHHAASMDSLHPSCLRTGGDDSSVKARNAPNGYSSPSHGNNFLIMDSNPRDVQIYPLLHDPKLLGSSSEPNWNFHSPQLTSMGNQRLSSSSNNNHVAAAAACAAGGGGGFHERSSTSDKECDLTLRLGSSPAAVPLKDGKGWSLIKQAPPGGEGRNSWAAWTLCHSQKM
ncbi:uncharacterized protein LOC127265434 [Andrographis paniculata]|uniref:uncharacterized protein LOC127265434 n=1 Tax=Andrographis paniculata TaxID=175694 RepID=UPI0021E77AA4|nr:uncharacterized protein LOC127265434 [Andrographis paniculata]